MILLDTPLGPSLQQVAFVPAASISIGLLSAGLVPIVGLRWHIRRLVRADEANAGELPSTRQPVRRAGIVVSITITMGVSVSSLTPPAFRRSFT